LYAALIPILAQHLSADLTGPVFGRANVGGAGFRTAVAIVTAIDVSFARLENHVFRNGPCPVRGQNRGPKITRER